LLALAERAAVEAETASRAKDEFLAVLSHELRSPLNAMLGWVRILRRAGTDDAMVVRAAETLERNVWAQAQVIDDLLDISRITSGKLQIERARVDLAAVVAGTVESMRPMAAGKRLTLELVMPHEHLDVSGDAARLQQVVGNVLHNAIKFTPESGRIAVRLREADGHAVVEVEDSGQGIEPMLLAHVFDRFVQSEASTTRRHGGLGLGLAIAKQLTVLHGGTVHAHSDGPGRGARFTITIPLAPAVLERDVDALAPLPAEPTDLGALDVLLVEDDDDSREALGIALEEGGARVRLAESVRAALAAYNARPPDVLVSDIGLPGEDGYALIRAIREREDGTSRRTLAIAMTGFASRHDHETALRAGFDDHVGKPVEPETLLERLSCLAASRSPTRRRST
jgi:CheY-like chemotaxis protein